MTRSTVDTPVEPPAVTLDPADRRRRGRLLARLVAPRRPRRRSKTLVVLAGVWVGLVVVVALVVQWLPLADPDVGVGSPNAPLGWTREFLGLDGIGRSELSRLAYGARASLGISVMACALAVVVGALLGILTAYFGSWLTVLVDIVTNAVLAVPALLLLLAIVLALRPSVFTLTMALGLIFVPAFARLTRAHAKTQLVRDYVIAAQMMGASRLRLMFREVLPNIISPLISYMALAIPSLIVTEGSLSFLGHGIPPPTPSWGAMIAAAQPFLAQYPAPVLVPCVVLFATVLALNILGDALRVRLDVREAQL
ncbi:ABC transporter permease [Dactylosporangium sp. CA-092794]|uniref:ABC transporter permease n=1 Tax=Dactylosporangium sp. CA-092794 TaxID=3239929 RepID=UPI003D8B0730